MKRYNVFDKTSKRLYTGDLLNTIELGVNPMVMDKDSELYYTFPKVERVVEDKASRTICAYCTGGKQLIFTEY